MALTCLCPAQTMETCRLANPPTTPQQAQLYLQNRHHKLVHQLCSPTQKHVTESDTSFAQERRLTSCVYNQWEKDPLSPSLV